jgi:hypothetical protein
VVYGASQLGETGPPLPSHVGLVKDSYRTRYHCVLDALHMLEW